MKLKFTPLLAVVMLTGLAACGKNSGEAGAASVKPQPEAAAASPAPAVARDAPASAALPKPDKTTPDEQYLELSSGNQVMFNYLSLAALPIDYKEVAGLYSHDYARASDEFQKNDLLKSLKPHIDAAVAEAGKRRYIRLTIDNPIEKYDFEKKGFPLERGIWDAGSYRYFNDNSGYRIGFSNGAAFRYLNVPLEERARTIESMRSKYESLQLVVYAFAQQADITNKSVKSEIVKVALLDRKGNVLASQ